MVITSLLGPALAMMFGTRSRSLRTPVTTDVTISIAWHKINGLETGDFDVTSSENEVLAACVYNIEDAYDPDTYPPEVSSGATGDSTDPDPDSHTTLYGTADTMFIGCCAVDRRNIVSYPTNCPDDNIEDGGGGASDASVGMANDGIDNSTFNPDNFGCGTADEWCACTVSLYRDGSISADQTINPNAVALTITAPNITLDFGDITVTQTAIALAITALDITYTLGDLTVTQAATALSISTPDITYTLGDLTVTQAAVPFTVSVPNVTITQIVAQAATPLTITAPDITYTLGDLTVTQAAVALTISVPDVGVAIEQVIFPSAIALAVTAPDIGTDISLTVTQTAVTLPITTPDVTYTLGDLTVTQSAVAFTITVPDVTVVTPEQTIYPDAVALPITAPDVTINATLTVTQTAVTLAVTAPDVTYSTTLTILPDALAMAITPQDVTLSFGDITVTVDAIAFPITTPNVTLGISLTLLPDAIAFTITPPDPTMDIGDLTILPDAIVLSITAPSITVDAGAEQTIYPSALTLTITAPSIRMVPELWGPDAVPRPAPTWDRSDFLYSGEPLPIPPPADPELAAFHRKLIDYLRRITTKLRFQISSVGALETFAAGIDGDQTFATASWEDIEWDEPWRRDASFAHDATSNPEQITLLQSGFYLMLIDVRTDDQAFEVRVADADGNALEYSYAKHVCTHARSS
jgi:hypothetical protein